MTQIILEIKWNTDTADWKDLRGLNTAPYFHDADYLANKMEYVTANYLPFTNHHLKLKLF